MLKFNTFRADRYLRSKFVEGRFFLASEASDLELEIIDLLRRTVKDNVGNIAIDTAWNVKRLSATQLLIQPGQAWYQGLPFFMRGGTDQLVSGASLTLGTVPPGVTVTDDSTGAGKILTFTGATTPTGLYRLVVSAQEEIITSTDDPFLQNANLTESTGEKVRLLFRLNIVLDSAQTETPVPYTNDTNTYQFANLVNEITITPSSGQNGELLATNPVSGSTQIDGRKVELTVRNDPGIGGGNPIPNGSTDQQVFYNGTLIDSVGAEYHVNAVFNDTISTQVILRIDSEIGQPFPQLINGRPYTLIKRDVYVTDDINGNPQGRLFWPIAKANWDTTNGFVHSSVLTDLRERVIDEVDFETITNTKFNLTLAGGGIVGVDSTGNILSWSSDFTLVNPSGPDQTIPASSAVVIDDGTLTYFLNLTGGPIAVGNLAVTVSSNAGSQTNFSGSPDLSLVKIGNILKVGSQIVQITAIDNVNKNVQVSPSLTTTGSGTIYRDSFAPATVPLNEKVFVLAVRSGGKFIVKNQTLSAGQSNAIYDERIQYPSGLAANTNITIPNNSRNSGNPQFYDPVKGELMIFMNQLYKFQGTDWVSIDNQTIQFNYALPNNAEVHFRINSAPAGSTSGGGSGSGTLQSAYNNGNVINAASGVPPTFNAPSGTKTAQFNGDIGITGIIDPMAMEFTPQTSNPLASGVKGLWVDTSGNLRHETGSTSQNVSQAVQSISDGTGIPSITRVYTNITGSTIPAGTPVYSPSAGNISPASGSSLAASKIIGVTAEAINPSSTGKVVVAGAVTGMTGFSHGDRVWVGNGVLTNTAPDIPTFSAGYYVVYVGVMEGTNLLLQIVPLGTL